MNVREVVFMACREQGLSLRDLAYRVSMDQGNLSRALRWGRDAGGGMKVSTLIKLLDALDAEIVVQTKGDDEYLLDGEEDGVLIDIEENDQAFPDC